MIVALAVLFSASLTGQDFVFGDEAIVEAFLEIVELCLKCVDSLERVIVKLIVFFHSLENLIGVDDVGVGLDVVVGAVDVLVLLEQVVAFGADYLGKDAV